MLSFYAQKLQPSYLIVGYRTKFMYRLMRYNKIMDRKLERTEEDATASCNYSRIRQERQREITTERGNDRFHN
jgi:hypothetical protein